MWQVLVRSEGRISVRQILIPLTTDLDLPDAALRHDAGVVITVVDEAGEVIAKAQARASPVENFRPRGAASGWREHGRFGFTDDQGRVELSRPEGASLEVTAWAEGFVPSQKTMVTGASGVVRLVPGKAVELRFLEPGNVPMADAVIGVDGWSWGGGFTGDDGLFVFAVTPDQALDFSLQRADGATYTGSLTRGAFDLERKDRGVEDVVLPAPVEFEARIIDAKSREPISSAFVWSGRDAGHFVRTAADGSYRLREFPLGSLRIGSA